MKIKRILWAFLAVAVAAGSMAFGAGAEVHDASHRTEVINASAHTCTDDGYTGDIFCNDCGAVIEYGEPVPAEHTDLESFGYRAPTCLDEGFTGMTYCNDCNETTDNGSPIPATGHVNTTVTDYKAPICTEDGFSGEVVCDECSRVVDKGSVIPAAHTEGEWVTVTEPTEIEEGLQTKSCTICGEELDRKVIPALSTPEFTYGDANGDDTVNLSDVTLMLQYIAKWDVSVNENAADANADGSVNLSDVTLMLQYIAKWDVVLG